MSALSKETFANRHYWAPLKTPFFQPTLWQSQTQAPISWVECFFVALAEKDF